MNVKEVENKIEWIDKRCSLIGEPLTEQQKEYIQFAFVNSEREHLKALDMHNVSGLLPPENLQKEWEECKTTLELKGNAGEMNTYFGMLCTVGAEGIRKVFGNKR